MTLKAKKPTPNVVFYIELGRYPISVGVKSTMIEIWQRINIGKPDNI